MTPDPTPRGTQPMTTIDIPIPADGVVRVFQTLRDFPGLLTPRERQRVDDEQLLGGMRGDFAGALLFQDVIAVADRGGFTTRTAPGRKMIVVRKRRWGTRGVSSEYRWYVLDLAGQRVRYACRTHELATRVARVLARHLREQNAQFHG